MTLLVADDIDVDDSALGLLVAAETVARVGIRIVDEDGVSPGSGPTDEVLI